MLYSCIRCIDLLPYNVNIVTSQGNNAMTTYETGVSNMNKLDVFTTEQTKALKGAFAKHTASLASGISAGNLVRKALTDASITAYELLPESNELFKGRTEVRPMLLSFIMETFQPSVKKLLTAKAGDCNDSLCFLWSERTNPSRVLYDIDKRTDELKKLGFKTMKEHRRDWSQQANSRLNDYRSSLAKATGVSLKKPINASDKVKGEKDASDKVKVCPIMQHAKNLLTSLQASEVAPLPNKDFNAIIKLLNLLTQPNH